MFYKSFKSGSHNYAGNMNSKLKTENLKLKTNRGYTLIELTVVMILLIVVGTLIVGIINSTLRGSTKSKITNDLAQNGNYALSLMSNLLLSAQKFQSIRSTSPVAGTFTSCENGPLIGDRITLLEFDGGITDLTCNGTNISSNSAALLDSSQVITTACSFTCTQTDPYSLPRIDISFQIKNATGATNEKQANATFSTSVSLRNQSLK